MTDRIDCLLRQYEDGDLQTRLNLFMEHRDLRPEFSQIDSCSPLMPGMQFQKVFWLPQHCRRAAKRFTQVFNSLIHIR